MAKTDRTMLSDAELEAFFAAGRARAPEPGPDLMARIVADAEAEIAARAPAPLRSGPRTVRARWAALLSGIGGWPALASMATAAVAGVWLGFASPDRIDTFAGGLLLPAGDTAQTAYELEDLLPGYDGFATLAEEDQG